MTPPPKRRPGEQATGSEMYLLYTDLVELVEEQQEYLADQQEGDLAFPKDLQDIGRQKEYDNLVYFDVFERVPRDQVDARAIISTRWEEKWKRDEVRSRLVAREFKWKQPERTDVFAATPTDMGLVLLLSIASAENLAVQTSDLTTAFMHAPVPPHDNIFVEAPQGYEDPAFVWRLRKAMNGIRAASSLFQDFHAAPRLRPLPHGSAGVSTPQQARVRQRTRG